MADHPLKPARDRRHGKPLPYHLANLTWANLKAKGAEASPPLVRRHYAVLAVVSNCCPPPKGIFPSITHPSAARQQSSKLLSVTARLACVKPAASVQSEP